MFFSQAVPVQRSCIARLRLENMMMAERRIGQMMQEKKKTIGFEAGRGWHRQGPRPQGAQGRGKVRKRYAAETRPARAIRASVRGIARFVETNTP